jgi:transposase-like protein
MRNILEKVRKRDQEVVKAGARGVYLAPNRPAARDAFHRFQKRRRSAYPSMVRQLERDLPELLSCYSFPKHLRRQLRHQRD